MKSKWMNKTVLAISIQMVWGAAAYAAEELQLGQYEAVEEQQLASEATAPAENSSPEEVSAEAVAEANIETATATAPSAEQAASTALQQQEGDATRLF